MPQPPARAQQAAAAAAIAAAARSAEEQQGQTLARVARAAGTAGKVMLGTVTAAIMAALVAFLALLRRRQADWLRSELGRYSSSVDDIAAAVQQEDRLAVAFARNSSDRVAKALPRALAITDPLERQTAISKILEAERRYAQQRSEAMLARAIGAVERAQLRRDSPMGAFWRIGSAVDHTAGCIFMSGYPGLPGRFWPWEVLDRVHPPRHYGCTSSLFSYGDAIEAGWMRPADIPDVRQAIGWASHVVMEARQADALIAELDVRDRLLELGVSAPALAAIPLEGIGEAFDAAELRDFHGRWTGHGHGQPQLLAEWPERGLAWQHRFDELPPDTPLWLFHATRREDADAMLEHGADPEDKPRSLGRERYEAGEYAEFAPGAGLGKGLSVALYPWDASGYGRVLLAVQVRKGDVAVSPEQANLGETSPGGALRVNDAIVPTFVPAAAFREVKASYKIGEIAAQLQEAFNPLEHPRDFRGRWAFDSPEANVLKNWTGARHHEIASGYVAGEPSTDQAQLFHRALMGLEPAENATLYRGMNLDLRDPEYPAERLTRPDEVAQHFKTQIGQTIDWERPSSTTRASQNMEKLTLGPGARVVFEVQSSRGRPMTGYAAHREAWESEAVLPPGRYRIDGVDVREFPTIDPFAHSTSEQITVVRLMDVTDPELAEAFNVDQPRWPKGHPRAGQWRPKLGVQGPSAGEDLERLVAPIRAELEAMLAEPDNRGTPGWVGVTRPARLEKLGAMIDDVAQRHTTAGAYMARRSMLNSKINELTAERERLESDLATFLMDDGAVKDRGGRELGAARDAAREAINEQLHDNVSEQINTSSEFHSLRMSAERAYRDSIVGVLEKIRPMGGKINADPVVIDDAPPRDSIFDPGTEARFHAEDLRRAERVARERTAEVQRLLPRAWIDDMNKAGTAKFEVYTARRRADHRDVERHEVRRLEGAITLMQHDSIDYTIEHGGSYEGMYDGKYPVVRRPGTHEGGIGPYAPGYDWIDIDGRAYNLEAPEVAPPGGFDPAKWNRHESRPEVGETKERVAVDSVIRVDDGTYARTYLHELGHRVQAVPGSNQVRPDSSVVHRAQYNYLTERTQAFDPDQQAKKSVQMNEVLPGAGYNDWEVTIPDEFRVPYYGKLYGRGYGDTYNELLTMALEDLYYSGTELREKDPRTLNWILGVLAGT